MRDELKELWLYRSLLRQMVERELRVRYKNSALGVLWSIVPPLMQVLVYTFFFRSVIGVTAQNYSAYMLCGMIPWTFFSAAILDSSQSLLMYYTIINKVYMPREIIPLAFVISNLIHFLLGWAVFLITFMVVAPLFHYGIPARTTMLLLPLLILMETMLVAGLSLFFSAVNVFYEDVKFILSTLFSLLIFMLPVLYPTDNIRYTSLMQSNPWLFKLYLLNPITALIEGFRHAMLEPLYPQAFNVRLTGLPPSPMDWPTFLGAMFLSFLILIGGYAYFNSLKWQFAERS